MKKILAVLQIGMVCVAFLSAPSQAIALTLSDTHPNIGQSVLLLDVDPTHFYAVYSITIDGPKSDPCAYISGSELTQDNDLTDYGTCFVNDNGTYRVVELSGDFFANFNDAIQSSYYVQKTSLIIQSKYLFSFSIILSPPKGKKVSVISKVTWRQNPQRTGSVSLPTYLSNWTEP